MSVYSVVLFLHIVGALGLFVALGIEFLTVSRLRSAATAEQAREWLSALGGIRVVGPIALVTILFPGLYMAATSTGWQGWNVAALGAMIVMAALGAASNAARMPGIGRSIGPLRGPLPLDARLRLRDPLVLSSILVRIGIALGVVLDMTVKPDVLGALVGLVAFALVGAAAAFVTGRSPQVLATERTAS
jgi:hypothetical protein